MDLKTLKAKYPNVETYTFGDSRTLCDEVLGLVRSGAKTATCAAMDEFGPGKEALPETGRRDVALDWDGEPAAMMETLSVEFIRFCDMDESRVAAQGEFRDLAHWQAGYRAYFERMGTFSSEMTLMFERFKMVQDFRKDAE